MANHLFFETESSILDKGAVLRSRLVYPLFVNGSKRGA